MRLVPNLVFNPVPGFDITAIGVARHRGGLGFVVDEATLVVGSF
jgi:hypothetical protein